MAEGTPVGTAEGPYISPGLELWNKSPNARTGIRPRPEIYQTVYNCKNTSRHDWFGFGIRRADRLFRFSHAARLRRPRPLIYRMAHTRLLPAPRLSVSGGSTLERPHNHHFPIADLPGVEQCIPFLSPCPR